MRIHLKDNLVIKQYSQFKFLIASILKVLVLGSNFKSNSGQSMILISFCFKLRFQEPLAQFVQRSLFAKF